MFDNAIIRYVAIAGTSVFLACQFVAPVTVKPYADHIPSASAGIHSSMVSLDATKVVAKAN
ncbi:hypothetical protein [Viridibacterium curvum]|uniref:Uncharacterized protein n=1 Tax=Viridibacterium curvum TaxID=1101404 RepID=A0ABP9QSE5_9RHOO